MISQTIDDIHGENQKPQKHHLFDIIDLLLFIVVPKKLKQCET